MKSFFEIPSFHDFIPPTLARELLHQAKPVSGVEGLSQVGTGGGLEQSAEALEFLIRIYDTTKHRYQNLLKQRTEDRAFIDQRMKACGMLNDSLGLTPRDERYQTAIGLEDAKGRTVVGALPTTVFYRKGGAPVAPIPKALEGFHVTLFGPPDSAKLAINAMNAYHRQLPGEPEIVAKLLQRNHDLYPIKWGADHEDSKTPIRKALVEAGQNLAACIKGDLSFHDQNSGKTYSILPDKASLPIKRITGLALPCGFLFYKGQPIPLHLYELALHVFHHQARPEALTFYVPKLENEEEAAYLAEVLRTAEELLYKHNSAYQLGTIRVLLVLENARAVFRIHEIMDALDPYFAGASLGWHDYLASTARLFKEDGNYRIPSKSDPHIVINHIKESHRLLADVVGSRGGIKIGGMYGVLPMDTDLKSPSFQVALRGFFKDVITQLKRDLTGFWVAHPDFARIGLALVEAWKLRLQDDGLALNNFIEALLLPDDAQAIKHWVVSGDSTGELNRSDPRYPLALLAADGVKPASLPNHDPETVRYNVFQSLQYLTDWLAGNGCVALPTTIDRQNVRVMDDLATAERSRWEVWHEVYHGRFKPEELIKIAFEELQFIRKNHESPTKKPQVRWDSRTQKWYPIALRLMLKLMTATKPPEFATELLLPFTVDLIRDSKDPWQRARELCPQRYQLDAQIQRMLTAFEACGTRGFARQMAELGVYDPAQVETIISGFSVAEISEAAFFHGDIGAAKDQLDEAAAREQALAQKGDLHTMEQLRQLGKAYQDKFGFKFLVSAEGRRAEGLLEILKARLMQTSDQEMAEARKALIAITQKRLGSLEQNQVLKDLQTLHQQSAVPGLAVAVTLGREVQSLCFGELINGASGASAVRPGTRFQLASLSKTIAAAFCLEFFSQHKIPLETSVQSLLKKYKSPWSLPAPTSQPLWAEQVTLSHLLSHTALSIHYVKGYPQKAGHPPLTDLLPSVEIIAQPGTQFTYSGGGFLVLDHLVELISGQKAADLIQEYLRPIGPSEITFKEDLGPLDAYGSLDKATPLPGGQLCFPGFAAGARGTARGMLEFMMHLTQAYQNLSGSGGISHDTAVTMLQGRDLGSREFMGCDMGLGVFVAEAGPNRFAVHQGANDGFRALTIMGFRGPDQGKGLVILCNGDQDGVPLVADVACRLLRHLDIQGIDLGRLGVVPKGVDSPRDVPAASRVNHAFKERIFASFEPDLPEAISGRQILSPLADQNLVALAKIHAVSNQRFAGAENLLSPYEPVFDPELYGPQGKVMDSWESVRHNPHDRDFVEFRLNKTLLSSKGPIYARFSTAFHDGNHPDHVRVLARSTHEDPWVELVPKQSIGGHSLLHVKIDPHKALKTESFDWIRVEMFPDGGLSRFGLFQDLAPEQAAEFLPPDQARSQRLKDPIPQSLKPLAIPYKDLVRSGTIPKQDLDYASALSGAQVVRASNQHYGPADQLISPFEPVHMFDGLETKRSRVSGHFEEVEIKLGAQIAVRRVVADFKYFVNNNPMFMSFLAWHQDHWEEFIPKTPVKGFAGLQKGWILDKPSYTDRILVRIYPDGGVHRIHVYES